MELQLESLKYQDIAVQSVVKVFDGTEKNTFDNACIEGIRSNVCNLTAEQIIENIKGVLTENGIDEETARLSADNDLCIEMETGTGKTLVYIKTIYELYKHYGFTKFIILVPSVAIRQGVLSAFKIFDKQLENIYGFTPKAFEYDSKRLNKVTNFIEELQLFKSWKPSNNVWDFVHQLKEGFQAFLGDKLFVDTFTIQKDVNTVFCLFFFTSHIKGFEKMLEAKWEIDTEQGKGWDYAGNQPSLFHEQKTNPLEEKLKEFFKSGKRYNGDLYEFTLRQGFLPKHTNEILYNWQNNDKIEVLTATGEKARKKSFYVAYNYYRDDNKKVSFKLK